MTQQEYDRKMTVLEAELAEREGMRRCVFNTNSKRKWQTLVDTTKRKIERLKSRWEKRNGGTNI